MQIGFIGLGVMGQPMALNLLRKGYRVSVYNRTAARCAPLQAAGATVAESPAAAAAGADIVCTMVTDDAAVEAVALGPNGALATMRPGAVLVDHSTIAPSTTRRLAAAAAERGVVWLDAPVTGGDIGARDGTLTIMVGGPTDAFQTVEPVLQAMGQRIVHVGPVGMGQSLKLVGNLISGLTLLAAAEGIRLAEAAGIPAEAVHAVLPYSSARSYELDKALDRWTRSDWAPGFSVANRTKDLRLAVAMMEELRFPSALAHVAYQVWAAHATAVPDEDEASILRRWAKGGEGSGR